ncbi:MAG: PD-(D/E)XK nuclease family protein, partial [Myxococcota bacterium]
MAVRFDDAQRVVQLSVRDLVEGERGPSLDVVQTRAARAAAGRRVHQEYADQQVAERAEYRPEVTVKRTIAVDAWTVQLWGRVDGLQLEGDHTVVEEVKSTALDARRLFATTAVDWAAWREQLEVYLWMLAEAGHPSPVGRLVLVSLVDGSRHVLGVAVDPAAVGAEVTRRLRKWIEARERRIAWLESRRPRGVPIPHASWRPGQREIAEAVEWGLEAGRAVLVQAPTGLGKTDAALVGALSLALRSDRQVFWATARTTQQDGPARAAERL